MAKRSRMRTGALKKSRILNDRQADSHGIPSSNSTFITLDISKMRKSRKAVRRDAIVNKYEILIQFLEQDLCENVMNGLNDKMITKFYNFFSRMTVMTEKLIRAKQKRSSKMKAERARNAALLPTYKVW